jgi:translocation and assembly module TamB
VQAIDLTGWQASLKLDGPLAAPELRAELREAATDTRAASSVDLQAQLRPFADWPLAGLQAQARELDLSRLDRQAPVTSLNLDATLQGDAPDQPITASIDLSNGAAGRWSEGRVPLRSLKATLLSRSDDRSTLELQHFKAELGDGEQPAGVVQGQGVWNALRASLDPPRGHDAGAGPDHDELAVPDRAVAYLGVPTKTTMFEGGEVERQG